MMCALLVEGKQKIQAICSACLVGTSLGSLIPLQSTLPNLPSPPILAQLFFKPSLHLSHLATAARTSLWTPGTSC